MQLTNEEIKNVLVLISRANITGNEATATAVLQQKLSGILQEEPIKPIEEKENKK